MADLADTIRHIPLFSGLSREDIAKVMGNLVEVAYPAGATIFTQGERGDALYLVQSGAVQVTLDVHQGRAEVIAVLGPQEYFGEMALLSSAPRSASVVALKNSTLWKLSRESWDELIAKHPSWLLHFCAVLSQRLSTMDRQYSQGRDAFNSLAEEFYGKRPADEQRFYRRAALLSTLDPKIVNILLETEKAAAFITDLQKSQLPLIRLIDGGYQLHVFFKDFLVEKLLETEGPEGKRQLHQRFAELYEEQDDWQPAVEQRIEANDLTGAIRLLCARSDPLLDQSALWVKNSIERMPATQLYADANLLHVYSDALCRLNNLAAAVRCYREALAQCEPPLGAETLARYQATADRLLGRNDYPAALNYLRNSLGLALQRASVGDVAAPSEIERRRPDRGHEPGEEPNLPKQNWRTLFGADWSKSSLGRWAGGVIGFAIWAYLWFVTPPIGLSAAATKQLGLLLLTFVYWVFGVFPDYGVSLIFALGFIITGMAKPEVVLGGFASTTWFMTLGVLGLGAAITSTGLFYRFSLQLVRYFPLKYNWQILALGIMGVVVMALIPQQSARTAIISQMLLNLSESLGYKNPSKASTGLYVASFLGLGQLGFLFLTGSTTSLIAWGLLPMAVRARFTWGYWFLAALPPTLIVIAIIVVATMLLFQPESQSKISYKMVHTQVEILGPLSKYEWITLMVLCFTMAGWLTVGYHKIDGAWVALLALCVLINGGVLGWGMLKKGVDWEMLIYMGATLSIPTLMTDAGIDHWMVGLFAPLIMPFTQTPAIAFVIIALITYVVKLAFTSFLTVVTLCIALLPLASNLHVNPWIIIMIVLIASEVWFFSFQVDWHTLAYASSDGRGFDYRLMSRISPFYAVAYLVALVAAIPYWRYLGLMQ